MKNLVFAATLLLFSASTFATSSSGSLTFQTGFVDRGVIAREDATLDLDLRVDDLIFDNVFATTRLTTTELTADSLKLRSDFGIGYGRQLGNFDVQASVNRLDATALYGNAYNEVRAEAGYVVAERLRVFGRASYPLTTAPSDLYATVGASYLIGNDWRTDIEVSGYKYAGEGPGDLKFNDVLAKVSYAVNDSVSLFGGYSYGGENRLDQSLTSKGILGASVAF